MTQVCAQPYLKTRCRYCDTPLSNPFLSLGPMALANSFIQKPGEEFTCPLDLTRCTSCHLVQLTHVVPKDLMFSEYLYVSSTTQTFRDHFKAYAHQMRQVTGDKTKSLAVDIGSNDGLLLSYYRKEGFEIAGVEPAVNLSRDANANGIMTLNTYFDTVCTDEILSRFGQASVISANNVFAHIDDIPSVLRNVKRLLEPEGCFVVEFPYLKKMIDHLFFDMIYHEHLSYISLVALQAVLKRHDLKIFHVHEVDSHGGSLRVLITHTKASRVVNPKVEELLKVERDSGYDGQEVFDIFADHVYGVKEKINHLIQGFKRDHKSICGYGAPAKGNTLINFCGLTTQELEYLVDDNPLKQNTLAPGSHIPVVSSQALYQKPTDVVIIFAWNFAKEIMSKLGPLKERGVQFMVPLPEPKIL